MRGTKNYMYEAPTSAAHKRGATARRHNGAAGAGRARWTGVTRARWWPRSRARVGSSQAQAVDRARQLQSRGVSFGRRRRHVPAAPWGQAWGRARTSSMQGGGLGRDHTCAARHEMGAAIEMGTGGGRLRPGAGQVRDGRSEGGQQQLWKQSRICGRMHVSQTPRMSSDAGGVWDDAHTLGYP